MRLRLIWKACSRIPKLGIRKIPGLSSMKVRDKFDFLRKMNLPPVRQRLDQIVRSQGPSPKEGRNRYKLPQDDPSVDRKRDRQSPLRRLKTRPVCAGLKLMYLLRERSNVGNPPPARNKYSISCIPVRICQRPARKARRAGICFSVRIRHSS